jgi:hypothetical protein
MRAEGKRRTAEGRRGGGVWGGRARARAPLDTTAAADVACNSNTPSTRPAGGGGGHGGGKGAFAHPALAPPCRDRTRNSGGSCTRRPTAPACTLLRVRARCERWRTRRRALGGAGAALRLRKTDPATRFVGCVGSNCPRTYVGAAVRLSVQPSWFVRSLIPRAQAARRVRKHRSRHTDYPRQA